MNASVAGYIKKFARYLNPFDNNISRQAQIVYNIDKEIKKWDKMVSTFINCLDEYKLHVGCVSGEANTLLYNKKIFNNVLRISDEVFKLHGEKPEKRLTMVAGPIIMLDSNNKSNVIELLRKNLVKLYYSDYRQGSHFRIGGWGDESNKDNLHAFVELPHNTGEKAFRRRNTILSSKQDKDKIDHLVVRFNNLIKELPEVDFSKELNEKFIFLNYDDIKCVRRYIKDHLGCEAYSIENEKLRNKSFYLDLMKEIGVKRKQYDINTTDNN